jgi:hypothetical protein
MASELANIQASLLRFRGSARKRYAAGSLEAKILSFIGEMERLARELPEMSDVAIRNEMQRVSEAGSAICEQIDQVDSSAGDDIETAVLALGTGQVTEAQRLEVIVEVAAAALRWLGDADRS